MKQHSESCFCDEIQYNITDATVFTHACYCKVCLTYKASAFVVHSIIEAENFVVDEGKLMTPIGLSGREVTTQSNVAKLVAISPSVTSKSVKLTKNKSLGLLL